MKRIKSYCSYNARRYGTPWVALLGKDGRPDFDKRIGGYTGGKGNAGDLFVTEPDEGQVYVYGQKDYRGNNTAMDYALYMDDTFYAVEKTELVDVMNGKMPASMSTASKSRLVEEKGALLKRIAEIEKELAALGEEE